VEQAFSTDVAYYEDRAAGIASVAGSTVEEARDELAARHGFAGWTALVGYVEALRDGRESPSSFMLAYRAVEAGDTDVLRGLLDRDPELVRIRGTNGNDLLGLAGGNQALVRLLLERGADANRGNDYGWTILHQAAYSNDSALARVALDAGADPAASARGDGGTPLVVALFWGHREVVSDLGEAPRNLRVAAGLGRVDLIDELVGTAAAAAHRAFHRPHSGFPAWTPANDAQEVLDEALAWAARSGRVEAIERLVELGARLDVDVYRGTALTWAAVNGHVTATRRLLELGADPNARGSFGGPDHGEGVTALHLAAQAGRPETVDTLLAAGADRTTLDELHGGTPSDWASFGGHAELAEVLRLSV